MPGDVEPGSEPGSGNGADPPPASLPAPRAGAPAAAAQGSERLIVESLRLAEALRAFAAELQRLAAPGAADRPGPDRPAVPDWAIQSEPVDIVGRGAYRLRFGPLPAAFTFVADPHDYRLHLPGTRAFHGHLTQVGQAVQHGSRYLTATLRVTECDAPYAGLVAWLY